MSEEIRIRTIQRLNPNPPEQPNIEIKGLLPSSDTLFNKVKEREIPNAIKSGNRVSLLDDEIKNIIKDSMLQALRIEEAARNPGRWNIPKDIVKKTALIVDFSAPGTYYQPRKEDRYKDYNWSWDMDRQRADISAILGIYMSGLATGNDFSVFTEGELLDGMNTGLNNQKDRVREALIARNMRFLYLGRKDEADAIRKVIQTRSSFVPPCLVDVIGDTLDINTVGQVKQLKEYIACNIKSEDNPNGFILPDSYVVLPIGLQAMRVLTTMNQFNAIPDGLKIAVFPIATSPNGINEYALLETKGRVFYTLTGQAAMESFPYILLGENQ